MLKNHFYIARLVSGFLMESLSTEEMQELQDWRESSPEHERLFQQICDEKNLEIYQRESQRFNQTEGWGMVDRKIQRTLRQARIRRTLSYAAAILLPLLIGTFVWLSQIDSKENLLADDEPAAEYILPGERKALLTLGSGEVIDLQDATHKEVNEKDGTKIDIQQSTLNYQAGKPLEEEKEILYNKIDVPHGGEYSLFLADGTKVYMNAMSSLRFPVRFTGDTRQVELEGEAYFEVTRSDKPFIVKVNGMDVEVLGTTFNLSSYPGETNHATLVSGSVKVSTEGNAHSRVLKPSQQARFNPESETFSVETVDVSLYTSWIDGKIYFKDERLETIMKTLSRWYDMEVVFKDESAKNLRFGCNVDRYKEIKPFLELLEKTDKVRISQDDKKIIIQSK